jgi:hypothetical protein
LRPGCFPEELGVNEIYYHNKKYTSINANRPADGGKTKMAERKLSSDVNWQGA